MFEMAKIERVLKYYKSKENQLWKELDDFKSLVPKTRVKGRDYYNDKENFKAKEFLEDESSFRRQLQLINGKYK